MTKVQKAIQVSPSGRKCYFCPMNRSTFLKSLFVLAASPKVLAEISRQPKAVVTSGIFNDLQFVIPEYIPALCKKYGEVNVMYAMGTAPLSEEDVRHIISWETQKKPANQF